MRTKLTLVLIGLVMASSTAAFGVTAPPLPTPYVFLQMTDHTNGANYTGVVGTYTRDAQGVWRDENGQDAVAIGSLDVTPAPGAVDGEDTWGVFAWKELTVGEPIYDGGGNVIGMDSTGNPADITYEWTSTSDTGLVGMYFAGQDQVVEIIDTNGDDIQDSFAVHVEHSQFELWAADTSQLLRYKDGTVLTNHEGPEYEENRRTAINRYEDWLDPDEMDMIPLLHGTSEYFRFEGSFVDAGGYFEGGTATYFNVTDTTDGVDWAWNDLIVPDLFTDPEGNSADIWFDLEIVQDNRDWLAKSNDDGGFQAIPEPMTMATAFMAIAGLGGYLKRRRNA